MRRLKLVMIGLGVVAGCVAFSLALNAATEQLRADQSLNFARACRFTGSNLLYTTATGSATGSTQTLSAGTAYKLYCTADSYFKQNGTAASTGSGFVKGGNPARDLWSKSGDYISLLGVSAAGTCYLEECQ